MGHGPVRPDDNLTVLANQVHFYDFYENMNHICFLYFFTFKNVGREK